MFILRKKQPGRPIEVCVCAGWCRIFEGGFYYKGAEEEFGEKRVYPFPLYLNRRMEREIYFPYPDRCDPTGSGRRKRSGTDRELEMSTGGFRERFSSTLRENLGELIRKEKTVVITHDMSHTGAPILAYHIARELKQNRHDVVVLAGRHGDGFLEEKFEKEEIPVLYLHDSTRNAGISWVVRPKRRDKKSEQGSVSGILTWILRDAGFSMQSPIQL